MKQEQAAPSALNDLVVVELGARIGAAVCSSLLAQLGATVVSVEMPSGFSAVDKSSHRDQLCAGKLSFAPDMTDDGDRALLKQLLARSDIVLTSSDFGDATILQLLPARPSTQVFCDITAFGKNGPFAGIPYSDIEIQAVVGMIDTTGHEGGPATAIKLPVVEYLTGVHAAGAVLAARQVVAQGGPGQQIDMALYDAGFAAMSSFLTRHLNDGDAPATKRIGNRHSLSAPWNVYHATDGWIQICTGSDLQWQRLCALMERPELASHANYEKSAGRVAHVEDVDRAIQSWIARHSVRECVDALNIANIPGGPIARIDGFPGEDNLNYRKMVRMLEPGAAPAFYTPGSPLAMSKTPGQAPNAISVRGGDRSAVAGLVQAKRHPSTIAGTYIEGRLPLKGIRVIEIGHYTTAPVSARYLASLGADVIKIEPPEGEASRAWPPLRQDQSLFYMVSNSDKRSITLDLTTETGQQELRSLLKTADVLIENLKPGTLTKRGFSPAELEKINPKLVYCAISGFGAHSLYAGRPAFDTVVQAMSGLMDLIKTDDTPLKTGISIADVMGASMAVVAVIAALNYRQQTGQGQAIDLSMQDILSWSTQLAWNGCKVDGGLHEIMPCADGNVLVTFADERSALPSTLLQRAPNQTRAQFMKQCDTEGIRAVPVATPAEALNAEQTKARDMYIHVADERGTWPALGIPLRLLGTPGRVKKPAPWLGQHNEEIIGPKRTYASAAE